MGRWFRWRPLAALAIPIALAGGCMDSGDPIYEGPASLCEQGAEGYEAFARPLIEAQCLGCHSAALEGVPRLGATPGVDFDTEADLRRHRERIRVRTVEEGTMPPGTPLAACEQERLDEYLRSLDPLPCTPDCSGRACGDDGCGLSCGDCGEGQFCDSAGACIDESSQAPTFSGDVWPILRDTGCAGGCHGGARPDAGLDLSTMERAYAALVGQPSSCSNQALVQPGDPAKSYLIAKLTGVGMCSGGRMPAGSPRPLAADRIDTIRSWIAAGAPND